MAKLTILIQIYWPWERPVNKKVLAGVDLLTEVKSRSLPDEISGYLQLFQNLFSENQLFWLVTWCQILVF